jgi:hypothetical protein
LRHPLAKAPDCREGMLSLETGQGPGTLARKLLRCKPACCLPAGKQGRQGGYGALFAVSARRSLGEGGHGTNFIACRCALPDEALRSRGRGTNCPGARN